MTGLNEDEIAALFDHGIVAVLLQTKEVGAQTKCGARFSFSL
jgi:hypothetical protein